MPHKLSASRKGRPSIILAISRPDEMTSDGWHCLRMPGQRGASKAKKEKETVSIIGGFRLTPGQPKPSIAIQRAQPSRTLRPSLIIYRRRACCQTSMNLFARIWNSSLGKKYIMAVSGCALFLFVIGHLVGNLQIFIGPEVINRYGHFLQTNWEIKWPARIGLLVLVALHIISAVRLTVENRAARGAEYDTYKPVGSSYASRTMMMSGLIIAAFVVYHLLHFTVLEPPSINLTGKDFHAFRDSEGRHDIFMMMVVGFSHPVVSLFYIVAIALLCLHLSHGVSSMFQSLGWKKSYYKRLIDNGSRAVAIAIFLGYISIPIAVMLGYGKNYQPRGNNPAPLQIKAEGK